MGLGVFFLVFGRERYCFEQVSRKRGGFSSVLLIFGKEGERGGFSSVLQGFRGLVRFLPWLLRGF